MKSLLSLTFFALLISMFAAASAPAQGFPWNDFKERTIDDLVSISAKSVRPDDSFVLATDVLSTRTEVTFTGKSREMPSERRAFLKIWNGMLGRDDTYAKLYTTEYLYQQGGKDYWLPTQEPITKYFTKELKPGDKMVLFLIAAGSYRENGNIGTLLLVEEYQLPQNLKYVIKGK